jgi:hypothetical protein
VARIELATPAGPEHITARLLDGLAVAITSGAPIRVADAVMDRLAVPTGAGQGGPMPEQTARDLSIDLRPRYEPRNLTFAAGLDHWVLGGSFTENTQAIRCRCGSRGYRRRCCGCRRSWRGWMRCWMIRCSPRRSRRTSTR